MRKLAVEGYVYFGGKAVQDTTDKCAWIYTQTTTGLGKQFVCAKLQGIRHRLCTIIPCGFPLGFGSEHIYYSGLLPIIHRTYNNNNYYMYIHN